MQHQKKTIQACIEQASRKNTDNLLIALLTPLGLRERILKESVKAIAEKVVTDIGPDIWDVSKVEGNDGDYTMWCYMTIKPEHYSPNQPCVRAGVVLCILTNGDLTFEYSADYTSGYVQDKQENEIHNEIRTAFQSSACCAGIEINNGNCFYRRTPYSGAFATKEELSIAALAKEARVISDTGSFALPCIPILDDLKKCCQDYYQFLQSKKYIK